MTNPIHSVVAVAAAWFDRHPRVVAQTLIPVALGRPGVDRRTAEAALRILSARHAAVVVEVARSYGQEAAAAAEEDPYAASAEPSSAEGEELDPDYEAYARLAGMRTHSTLTGSTGLMRVREAGGGPSGSFRFSFQAGMNGMSGFLCTESAPCPNPVTGFLESPDSSQRFDTRLNLSVTPFPFLEAFASMRSTAISLAASAPTSP